MFELHLQQVLVSLAKLFRYPSSATAPTVEELYVLLQHEIPTAAAEMAAFGELIERWPLERLEETYTRTFEINSKCAPEIGWHLFGEEFTRGMLLVRMREELARYEIPESTELPDHISHALQLVAAMPREESDRFVPACLFPALLKMRQSAERQESPYRHVIVCLEHVLRHEWGPLLTTEGEETAEGFPAGVDPLHAFPVLGQEDDACGGCGAGGAPVIDPRILQDDRHSSWPDTSDLPTDPRRHDNLEEES